MANIETNSNFFFSMCSEDGKISSKRVSYLAATLILIWLIGYAAVKLAPNPTPAQAFIDFVKIMVWSLMGFIFLMSGVATIKDIIAFKNGTKADDKTDAS